MSSFCDEVAFHIRSGKGGDGCVSYRREKYIPKGGPDGGDGGNGGDVIFQASSHLNTLSHLRRKKLYHAEDGEKGHGSNRHGKNGEPLTIEVPEGTIIFEVAEDGSKKILADLTHHSQKITIVEGGRGGFGNAHFISSTRQAPDFAELGDIPEEKDIFLELKVVAEVGIIGLPSVGKSTLISIVSNARPKIADYPFTTLIPNLGVVDHKGCSFVITDVPGLIEGAHEGKGLGHQFLKHIERTEIVVHVIDGSHGESSIADYFTIRTELESYSKKLALKEEIIVINKTDLLSKEDKEVLLEMFCEGTKKKPKEIFMLSSATKEGLTPLLDHLVTYIKKKRETYTIQKEEVSTVPVILKPLEETDEKWTISTNPEGEVVIRGRRIEQIIRMSNLENQGSLERVYDILIKLGIQKALSKKGLLEGDLFNIANKKIPYREPLIS